MHQLCIATAQPNKLLHRNGAIGYLLSPRNERINERHFAEVLDTVRVYSLWKNVDEFPCSRVLPDEK